MIKSCEGMLGMGYTHSRELLGVQTGETSSPQLRPNTNLTRSCVSPKITKAWFYLASEVTP